MIVHQALLQETGIPFVAVWRAVAFGVKLN